ncbi:class I adenylate-forming enzyme family protein [Microbacterium sp. BWT-B31]|uniref:class I adenylate-forming enzyme family protein n=1 Tax=Microbacterium sp. BWT-B31 TaxID=3232072 RepID=UPI003527B99A
MDIGYILRSTRHKMGVIYRNRPALSLGETTLTYAELDRLTCRYAHALVALGVKHGDRVALMMYNAIDYAALYFAITSIGAVCVRLNFRLGPDELRYMLNDSGTRVLIADSDLIGVIDNARAGTSVERFVFRSDDAPEWASDRTALWSDQNTPPDLPIPDPQDPAMLMYTSGSTGPAKGVVWTHSMTMWFAALQALRFRLTEDTVMMVTGPMYHVGGLENFILGAMFVHGHGVVNPSRGFKAIEAMRSAERHRVTDVFMFSFTLVEVLQDPDVRDLTLKSIRTLRTGGTGIPTTAADDVQSLLPGVTLDFVYGMTEMGNTTTTRDDVTPETTPNMIGTMFQGTETRVLGPDGTELDYEQEGEITVRSPAGAAGYWNRPEDSASVFRDGWIATGDLGIVDRQGRLRLSGRAKDIVRTGGENVHPGEVESVLIVHPAVADVAVIGVPDPRLHEAICALVVVEPGADVTAEELIEFVRSKIASYKKPRHVVFVSSLPRNASGKLLKPQLRNEYAHIGTAGI